MHACDINMMTLGFSKIFLIDSKKGNAFPNVSNISLPFH